jgi:hypothetical protein
MSSTPVTGSLAKAPTPLPPQAPGAKQTKAVTPPAAPAAKPAPAREPVTASSKVALGGSAGKQDDALYSSTGTLGVPAAAGAAAGGMAVANGVITAGGGHVTVDIEASDSAYQNKMYYSTDGFKTKHYIGADNQVGSVDIGQFQAGTKIEFGIDNGQGDSFRSGGADKNADGVDHVQTTRTADGGVRFGFEDLRGGGDRDYNDAVIKVRETPAAAAPVPAVAAANKVEPTVPARVEAVKPQQAAQAPKPAPVVAAPTPAKPPVSAPAAPVKSQPAPATNRSGLADGTNPGQGAQHTNSANPGTLNPNGAGKATVVPVPVKAAAPATVSNATSSTRTVADAARNAAAVTSYQQVASLAATVGNAADKKNGGATPVRA